MMDAARTLLAKQVLGAVSRVFDDATSDEARAAFGALRQQGAGFSTLDGAQAARELASAHLNELRAAVAGVARLAAPLGSGVHGPLLRAGDDVREAIHHLRLATPVARDADVTLGLRGDAVQGSHGLLVQDLGAARGALSRMLGASPR